MSVSNTQLGQLKSTFTNNHIYQGRCASHHDANRFLHYQLARTTKLRKKDAANLVTKLQNKHMHVDKLLTYSSAARMTSSSYNKNNNF